MKPVLYVGSTRHERSEPLLHRFSYPLFQFALEVSTIASAACPPLFAYNRKGLFSIHDSDYLHEGTESIQSKVATLFKERGIDSSLLEVTLLTMPRFLGYVFNPVSFYLIRKPGQELTHLIAEVHNTFGDKHVYLLTSTPEGILPQTFVFPKEFYVSPFFDVSGEYNIEVRKFGEAVDLEVSLQKGGTRVFRADFRGTAKPLTRGTLFKLLVQFPLTALLTMTRIHLQALKLYLRGLRPVRKPAARHAATIRSAPRALHLLRLRAVAWLSSSGEK